MLYISNSIACRWENWKNGAISREKNKNCFLTACGRAQNRQNEARNDPFSRLTCHLAALIIMMLGRRSFLMCCPLKIWTSMAFSDNGLLYCIFYLFVKSHSLPFFGGGAFTLTNDGKKEKRFIYLTECLVKSNWYINWVTVGHFLEKLLRFRFYSHIVCMYEYVHFVQTIFVKTIFPMLLRLPTCTSISRQKSLSLFRLMKWVWLCFYLQITEYSGQRQWKNWVSFLNSKCTWTYSDVMELSECFGDMWKNWKMTT